MGLKLRHTNINYLYFADYTAIESGNFHQVTTTSEVPACFVYTFQNVTDSNLVLKSK